jgi:hypothetical protein
MQTSPTDQVMEILGFTRDPNAATVLDAVAMGLSPGVLSASERVAIYGAIHANFAAIAKVVAKVRTEFSAAVPMKVKAEIHRLVLEELNEQHFGGRWFLRASPPDYGWVALDQFSPAFGTPERVFYLPAPYVDVLRPVI